MIDFDNDTRRHLVQVVATGSQEWYNYINFRDYLNVNEKSNGNGEENNGINS